jgi:hypothetical protein
VFVTSHTLAGASIGLLVRRPGPAFALGVASHVAMDLFPHYGDPEVSWEGFLQMARRDGIIGLGVIAAAAAASPADRRTAALAGMAGAAVLDLDKVGKHFIGRSPFPPRVDRFHRRIQNESPKRRWIEATSAGLLAAVLALVLRRLRSSPA